MHPVFHVSLLEPAPRDQDPQRVQPPPPPEIIDNEEFYTVKEILDSRIHRRKLQYFVDWEGYGINERSWEPASQITIDAPEAIAEFHEHYPNKPGPDTDRTPKKKKKKKKKS